jgi:Ca2+/Na+ antiporter
MFDFIVRQKAKFMRGMTYFLILNTLFLVYLSFKGSFPLYIIAILTLSVAFAVWLVGHIDIKSQIQQKENEIVATWNPVLVNIQESLNRIEKKFENS